MTLLDSKEPIEDGTYIAVVDSVEDGIARIFIEDDETEIGSVHMEEDDFPISQLGESEIYDVYVEDEKITGCKFNQEETQDRIERMQEKFDRLSSRKDS